MNRVLIVGGGDLAKQINHHISNNDLNASVVGFVDDTMPLGSMRFNKPCLGKLIDMPKLFNTDKCDTLIIGVGYKHLEFRKKIFEELSTQYPFYSFCHSTSYIDVSAKI